MHLHAPHGDTLEAFFFLVFGKTRFLSTLQKQYFLKAGAKQTS